MTIRLSFVSRTRPMYSAACGASPISASFIVVAVLLEGLAHFERAILRLHAAHIEEVLPGFETERVQRASASRTRPVSAP